MYLQIARGKSTNIALPSRYVHVTLMLCLRLGIGNKRNVSITIIEIRVDSESRLEIFSQELLALTRSVFLGKYYCDSRNLVEKKM